MITFFAYFYPVSETFVLYGMALSMYQAIAVSLLEGEGLHNNAGRISVISFKENLNSPRSVSLQSGGELSLACVWSFYLSMF